MLAVPISRTHARRSVDCALQIYGELVGYGANSDGYDMVAPSGEGGQRCMKMAMAMADEIGGVKQVDYVNTHGTSTPVRRQPRPKHAQSRPMSPAPLTSPLTARLVSPPCPAHLSLP